MVPLLFVKEQLEGFRRAISRVGESAFPYPYEGPEAAVRELSLVVDRLESTIERAMHPLRHAGTARQACEAAHHALRTYLPLLGFLLRSTNTRNAFEVCGPLQRLISQFLSGRKLVLSSEWQFAPFTEDYQGFGNFVFIGFPASEANNPLLFPLAAHEFGHPVWRGRAARFRREIETWLQANPRGPSESTTIPDADRWVAEWAARKLEEAFCDCLAVRVFGESFLHAAAYMLASRPSQKSDGEGRYLGMKERVGLFVRAATKYEIPTPSDYAVQFESDPYGDLFAPPTDYDMERAERCALAFADDMISEAKAVTESATPAYELPLETQVNDISRAFELRVPPSDPASLAAILNAAWRRYLDIHPRWDTGEPPNAVEFAARRRSTRELHELVLKTIEVFEYRQLLREE